MSSESLSSDRQPMPQFSVGRVVWQAFAALLLVTLLAITSSHGASSTPASTTAASQPSNSFVVLDSSP